MKKIYSLMVALAIIGLTSCSDDIGEGKNFNDGFLHFNFVFNPNDNAWREADGPKKTRIDAPIKVETEMGEFQPLYLHTVVEDHIDMPKSDVEPVTRGQRYTGDVFYGTNSIQTFSVYGEFIESGGTFSQMSGLENFMRIEKEQTTPENNQEYSWRYTDITISQEWSDSKKANFYGCAPAGDDPTNPDCAKGVTTDVQNTLYNGMARPTLFYSMPAEEADHKDVLIAKTVAPVSRGQEVELEFHHILSAIRFKYANSNGLKIKVKEHANGDILDTYDIKVKKLQLQGIYKEGQCNMSQELTPSNASSFWTVGTEKGECAMDFTDEIRESLETGYFNDDAHCLMVLPQTAPTGARVLMTCDLMSEVGGTPQVVKADVTFGASLAGKQWLPGYSYTYSLSDTEFFYYLDAEGLDIPDTISIPLNGAAKEFTVDSYLTNSTGGQGSVGVDWHPEYSMDNGATWTSGLPLGYLLKYSDDTYVTDMSAVTAEAGPTTYKLVAAGRSDHSVQVANLRAVEYTDYDLSTKGGTVPRTTANTYIVHGVGTFKLPIVYGNAITQGATNSQAYTTKITTSNAPYKGFVNYNEQIIKDPWIYNDTGKEPMNPCIVWQDSESLITTVSVTKEDDGHYLNFTVSEHFVRAGNSVIAVRDNEGNIMWSWLIWVTDFDFEGEGVPVNNTNLVFTTRNLGWIDPEMFTVEPRYFKMRVVQNVVNSDTEKYKDLTIFHEGGTVSFSGSSLYWQWGRKDPQPGYSKDLDGAYDMAAHQYNATYPWHLGDAAATQLSDGIRNPHIFYITYLPTAPNWISKDYRDLWNIAQTGTTKNDNVIPTKTVYDPCPPGYVVPPGKAFDALYSMTSYTGAPNNGRDTVYIASTPTSVRIMRLRGSDGRYFDIYRLGARIPESGSVENFDEGMTYTTSERYSSGNCRACWYNGPKGIMQNGSRNKVRGGSVRAVRESWNNTSYTVPTIN